jgi:uncharacterized protein
MIRNLTLLILAAVLTATSVLAGFEPPANRGYVTDVAGALRTETVRWLSANLQMMDRQGGVQMAVLVVPDLQGTTPMDFAQRTFDAWKIGHKTTSKGLLFLVATGDRKVRLHVGYGLEGDLPDGKVGALLDSHVTPRFKSGDLDGGVMAGVGGVMSVLGTAPLAPSAETSRSRRRPASSGSPLTTLVVVVGLGILCMVSPFCRQVVLQVIIMSAFSGRGSGGSFSGGSGFGGFGGGSSGGGGADRGW